jgi:fatty-acid desaturase
MSTIPAAEPAAVSPRTRQGGNHHHDKPRLQGALVFSVVVCHLGCLAAPFTFSWSGLGVLVALWWITGGLGICLGYHRQLTHASYKTYRPIKYALVTLGCLANEGAPIVWTGTHRLHHRHADEHDDPHSPNQGGFAWGHLLWTFFYEHAGSRRAAKDLERDWFIRTLDRWCLVPTILLSIALFMLGGWSWLVWGVFVRTVFVLHCTWFVNSAAHTWGYRTFDTTDGSKNNWWVALLTFGEGWHNNHHAYHRSAAHGLKWWEFDPTYITIRAMELAGLAWDVKRPPAQVLTDIGSPITRMAEPVALASAISTVGP